MSQQRQISDIIPWNRQTRSIEDTKHTTACLQGEPWYPTSLLLGNLHSSLKGSLQSQFGVRTTTLRCPGLLARPGKSSSSDWNSAAEAQARAEPSSPFRAEREAPRSLPGRPERSSPASPASPTASLGAEGPPSNPGPSPELRRAQGPPWAPRFPGGARSPAQPGPEPSAARPGASPAGAAAGSAGARRPLPVTWGRPLPAEPAHGPVEHPGRRSAPLPSLRAAALPRPARPARGAAPAPHLPGPARERSCPGPGAQGPPRTLHPLKPFPSSARAAPPPLSQPGCLRAPTPCPSFPPLTLPGSKLLLLSRLLPSCSWTRDSSYPHPALATSHLPVFALATFEQVQEAKTLPQNGHLHEIVSSPT